VSPTTYTIGADGVLNEGWYYTINDFLVLALLRYTSPQDHGGMGQDHLAKMEAYTDMSIKGEMRNYNEMI